MIKAVMFDFDGTLIDTNSLIIASFKYTYKKHLGIDVPEEDIVKYFGEPLGTTLARYSPDNYEELMVTYKEYNSSQHDNMAKAMPNAAKCIKALKKAGYKTGIVTSKRKKMTDRGIDIIGIADDVDVIITMEDTNVHKPEAEPLLCALRKINMSPEETLYVGDSHYDILCGQNAGSKTCLVKFSVLDMDELMKYSPDYVVDDLYDIVDILNQQNK